jgi:hypothetical protein
MDSAIPQGTEIGRADCPGCGQSLPVKINKAGCAYFYCAAIVGERNGKPERCFTRLNVGRVGSQKMIENFLAERQSQNVQPEPTHIEIPTEPEPAGGDTGIEHPIEPAAVEPKRSVTSWFD